MLWRRALTGVLVPFALVLASTVSARVAAPRATGEAGAASWSRGDGVAVGRPPNIVMLMTDDQTATSLRFLPNVQRLLVNRGVTFTNAFVTTPLCCPSRTSYFTGQYAHNHGVLFNHGPTGGFHVFRHQETTFPVALHAAGYRTAHIGKYLNGYGRRFGVPPGWDEFYGTIDPWTYNYYGFQVNHNGRILRFPRTEPNYNTDVFAQTATSLIHRWSHGAPFFLNVAFVAPHAAGPNDTTFSWEPDPVVPDPNEIDYRMPVPPRRYRGHLAGLQLPHPASFDEQPDALQPSFLHARPLYRPFTAKDVQDIAARYHAQLESLLAVDDAVARIVDALRATGELDRTVIVFTSDNGFFNGEHRIRAGKYYAYDPSIRVPLVIREPGLSAAARRTEDVANIDLAPTLLDLAHVAPLRPPDGVSLVPLMSDPSVQLHRDLLIETAPNDIYPVTYHAVRTARYYYIRYSSGDRELFDLQHDPDELHNQIERSSSVPLAHRLDRELVRLQHCAAVSCRTTSAGSAGAR